MERVCALLRERITKTQACAESAHRKRGRPPWLCLELFQGQSHPDGAVIRSHDFREDEGRTELGCQRGGYPAIIDPPAHIPGTSPCPITPPRVMASSQLEDAKGVDETRIDQSIERSPLLGAESGVFDIFFRTGQVDFLMGYIEVSAEKNRLLLPQSTEVLQKQHPIQGGSPGEPVHSGHWGCRH